jgi:N-methylhydantoinase B
MAPGAWRGGIGTIREFRFLADAGFSIEGDGHAHAPWGFDGGADGHTASLTLVTADGTVHALPSKVPYARVKAGDRLIAVGPCGGGYGEAALRTPAVVARDVADGLISAATALRDFGVLINADGSGERR